MNDQTKLRAQAEAQFARLPESLTALSPTEIQKVLHELRVHQIELEMQNEELRQAQVNLDAARARYFDLYDLAPVGYCTLSEHGLILESNLVAAAQLGVVRSALIQQRIAHFIHKDDQALYYLHRKLLFETGAPQFCELRLVKMDQTTIWAHLAANAAQDAQGAPTCRIVMSDITERKQAEEQLRASEERYRSILNASPDGIVIIDAEGRTHMVSPATTTMFGFAPDTDLRGILIADYITPEDRERVFSDMALLFHGHKLGAIEYRARRADGSFFDMEVNSEVIRNAEGHPIQMVSVIRDITNRKRAEAEKDKLENQLMQAQKMESVGRLAGGVAHDFNNMLTIILGQTELAIAELEASHPVQAGLAEIRQAAARSANLTRQLLAFARKQTVAPQVLDLNRTVESTLNMLRRLIGENIELVWLPGNHLEPIKMDPSQIDQILTNLCINARDAIAGEGKLTIKTGTATFAATRCAQPPGVIPGDYVQLSVSDTGGGMDKQTLANIFEPFFTTKGVGQGTGLGLATVYGIMKQNGGFINVQSEPGQGATFHLYLPQHRDKDHLNQNQVLTPAPLISQGHETILLVEDEPAILIVGKTMLERLGYQVLCASTPGAAIHLAEKHSGGIQLLITDVVMPEMNGRDLAKNLLTLYPNLKRLFMSGYTADVIAHHGVLFEGVDFIQKPFSLKNLSAKVREVLDGKISPPPPPA